MEPLESELKQLVIETFRLDDLDPAAFDVTTPLFGDGLGLDSIDALELGIALKKKYAIRIEMEPVELAQHFASIASLAAFVAAEKTRTAL